MSYKIEYLIRASRSSDQARLRTDHIDDKTLAWQHVQYLMQDQDVMALIYPAEIDPAFYLLSVS